MPTTTAQDRPALTDAQRAVLAAAALRPEGALILPARLKGKAAETLARALLERGFAREIRAKGELPIWRKDEATGRGFTLVLTKAGRALVSDESPEAQKERMDAPQPASPALASDASASSSPEAPRPGSKLAAVIALLGRDQGGSLDELIAATGWLPHTTRAALTGLRKRGFAVTRSAGDHGSVYRIAALPAAAQC